MTKRLSLYILIFLLSACGPFSSEYSNAEKEKKVKSFSFDGVKLISSSIKDGQDTKTFNQTMYGISSESRLLVRFESLRSSKNSVVLSAEDDIWLRITIKNEADGELNQKNYQDAITNFKLCPLTRGDWMMLATWGSGHPFSTSGKWAQPGGDYDAGACVTGTGVMTKDPSSETKSDEAAIYFKITRWFKDYVLGRDVNYGHILINEGPLVQIYGDASGSYSPRILWTEVTTVQKVRK